MLVSQTMFEIPKPVEDFSLYTSAMHCSALTGRLNAQMITRKDSSFGQSNLELELKGLKSIDTFPTAIQKPVQKCLQKFDPNVFPMGKDRYGVDYYDALARLYWIAGDAHSFFSMVNRKDTSLPYDSLGIRTKYRNSILSIIGSIKPVDLATYDSLVYSFFLNDALSHKEDLKKFQNRLDLMQQMATLRFRRDPEDHLNRLMDIARVIDSMRIDRFSEINVSDSINEILNGIRIQHRYILSQIRQSENMDSLERFGPASYFRGLVKNSHLAGFDTASSPPIPLGRKAISLEAIYVFSPDGTRLQLHSAGNSQNRLTDIPDTSRPSLMVFIHRPIPTTSRDLNALSACGFGGQGRYLGSESCHEMIRYLKYVSQQFPDLQIVVVVPTRGHLGQKVTVDTGEEAEVIRRVFQDFHGISAYVVVHHNDYYRIPNPDERRINLYPGYERHYKGAEKGSLYYGVTLDRKGNPNVPARIPGFILAPGGVVVAEYVNAGNHNLLEKLMKWYRGDRQAAVANVND